MADDDRLDQIYADMNLIADGFPLGQQFFSSCLHKFKQLLRCSFPELPAAQVLAAFEQWAHRYEARDAEREHARMVLTLNDWLERDGLQMQLKFLPPGRERESVERQLWELANKVADRYAPRRPQPLAAKWAADEKS